MIVASDAVHRRSAFVVEATQISKVIAEKQHIHGLIGFSARLGCQGGRNGIEELQSPGGLPSSRIPEIAPGMQVLHSEATSPYSAPASSPGRLNALAVVFAAIPISA